jgi:uncharacterized protein (TIGR02996 family)
VSEGATLRAAIWADPSDLDAYRVYADWLIEQGNSLGEFIQLALAAATDEQRKRAATLLKRDRASWLGPARPFVRSWTNDTHGFAATATCEAQKLLAGFSHLLEIGPRLRLSVTSMAKRRRATVAELSKLELGRFYALSLASSMVDRDVEALAPALAGIRRLDLGYNSFTGAALRKVGEHVAGIRTLSIISHNYADDWVDAIVETPGFATLEHVEIHGHNTKGPDSNRLARLQAMPAMKRVNAPRAWGSPTIPMDPAED